jgi:hypothetical protein
MDAHDVLEIIQTTLTTFEKMFQVGRYRIQTCFFLQGGFITANRPDALLKLRYRDIKVSIDRDPNGGPHNIVLEWTYEFTKSFLGPKAAYVYRLLISFSSHTERANLIGTHLLSLKSSSIPL